MLSIQVPCAGATTKFLLSGLFLSAMCLEVVLGQNEQVKITESFYQTPEKIMSAFPDPAKLPIGPDKRSWQKTWKFKQGEYSLSNIRDCPYISHFVGAYYHYNSPRTYAYGINITVSICSNPQAAVASECKSLEQSYGVKPVLGGGYGDECWVFENITKSKVNGNGEQVQGGRYAMFGRVGPAVFFVSSGSKIVSIAQVGPRSYGDVYGLCRKTVDDATAKLVSNLSFEDTGFRTPSREAFAKLFPETLPGGLKIKPVKKGYEPLATTLTPRSSTPRLAVMKGRRQYLGKNGGSVYLSITSEPELLFKQYTSITLPPNPQSEAKTHDATVAGADETCIFETKDTDDPSKGSANGYFRKGFIVGQINGPDKAMVEARIQAFLTGIGTNELATRTLTEEDEESLPIILDITAYASGHIEAERAVTIKDENPQQVVITGQVMDQDKTPIISAEVSVVELEVTAITDGAGRYRISLEFEDGKGTKAVTQDFVIQAIPGDIIVRLEPIEPNTKVAFPPVANGKAVRVRATVTADGEPHVNQRMSITYPKDFYHGTRCIDYIANPVTSGCTTWFQTDEKGQAIIEMGTPAARKDTQAIARLRHIKKFQENMFPIQGEMYFADMTTGKRTSLPMQYRCPFPRITQFATPALWAGKWPSERGRLAWTNVNACSNYSVTFHVRGDIRSIIRPGVEVSRGTYSDIHQVLSASNAYQSHYNLSLDIDTTKTGGQTLEFAIRPDMVGDDFAQLPPEWTAAVLKSQEDVLLEYAITRFGAPALGKAAQKVGRLSGHAAAKGRQLLKMGKATNAVVSKQQQLRQSYKVASEGYAAAAKMQAALIQSGKGSPTVLKAALNASRNAFNKGLTTAAKSKVVAVGGAALRGGGTVVKKTGQVLSKTLKHTDGYAAMESLTMGVTNLGFTGWKTWETRSIEIDKGGITAPEVTNSVLGLGEAVYSLAYETNAEQMLALKATWAASKAFYENHCENMKIAYGWDDAYPLPAVIRVTNADGYTAERRQVLPAKMNTKSK